MKLEHDWQWDMLYTTVESLEKKGILTSPEWKEKVKNRTLTVSEATWLNMIILDRLF